MKTYATFIAIMITGSCCIFAGCHSGSGNNDSVKSESDSSAPAPAYRMNGLNFSPFIDGQDPNLGSIVSESQLQARLAMVSPYTKWIRTFGCTNGLEKTGRVAHSLGLRSAMGAWISKDSSANDLELTNLIMCARAGEADRLIVGSEVLLRKDLSEDQLISYINRIRAQAPRVPVGYADTYAEILAYPRVVDACDFILANYYPYWEGIAVDKALASVDALHRKVVDAAKGKPVIVGESGWPSAGNTIGSAVPSPDNASFYFLNFVSWARANNVDYFYFEAFDETWKQGCEGPQGSHWGIWDKDGKLKPGMQLVFDGEIMADTWSSSIPGGPGTPSIGLTAVPIVWPQGSRHSSCPMHMTSRLRTVPQPCLQASLRRP